MSPRGQKPKPTHLKLVQGTLRKCRMPKNEPHPALAIPVAPAELSADARAEWDSVSADLFKLGILTRLDHAVLAAYCSAFARWVSAERELRKLDGGAALMSAFAGISNRAALAMVRYATELGMSPASRTRISANPPADVDPAEKYFTRG
jgi:P27 family predicted phage terminase small subunit